MKSVKTKIGMLVLLCVLVVAVLIGNVSIGSAQKVVEENSEQILELLCDNNAQNLNALMLRIEQSVITLSDYATAHIGSLQEFKTSKDYVRKYSEQMEDIALNAAVNTEGAMTVYIRYNPDFTEPTSGVFYSKPATDSEFQKLTPTDFSMYEENDAAHVGWYYIPVHNGRATWLDPYVNENLGIKMISYVIPLIVDGTSVGIVGMDIDFGVLEDIVNNVSVYESGYAFIANAGGQAIQHPDFEMGEPFSASQQDELSGLTAELQKEAAQETLFSYTYHGNEKKMAFSSLRNGMRFAITAPTVEINREASQLILKICIIVAGAILLSLLISWAVIRGIVKPLKELDQAAREIAAGKLDITLRCHSKDEVGALADSFRKTVERLRNYIVYISEIATVLGQMAGGDLVIDLKQNYEGEFSRIKEALQLIADTLSSQIYQIKVASGQVSDGADQVSNGAQILSRGAAEQSSAIEALSALMEQMLQQARKSEEEAKKASQLTKDAGSGLEESGVQMQAMIGAMGKISDKASAITEIVHSINDIAMQTNILALNAAIEAARAGEAGKGFSIVADQVKNLAEKSIKAASNIEELVSNAVDSIADGEKIAAVTEKYILETVNGAKSVVGLVEGIVSSSAEQATATIQVQERVESISAVVQQNSITSQESAAASEELSAQAQMLKNLVAKFRLDETANKHNLLSLK